MTKHQPPASPLTSAEGTLDPDRITLALIQALIPLGLRAVEEAPRAQDTGLFARVLGGLSTCEDHPAAAIPEAFGLAKSSVSRRFVHARARCSSCKSGGWMIASGSCCCSMVSRSRPTN